MSQPSGRVLQRLVTGPTLVSRVVWFDRIGSTNAEVTRRAADGAEEGLLILADDQTAGRGRQGRGWSAPPGTSLMGSLLLRPDRSLTQVALLPLLVGLALVEACEPFVSGAQLSLKWPNDLLADGRKCAGILVEVAAPGVVVVGMGVNVDWRGVERPAALGTATSLSEVGRGRVDRWKLLPVLLERVDRWHAAWCQEPASFLPAYRERCATLGCDVRVDQMDGTAIEGTATQVTDDGALVVTGTDGTAAPLHAGEVHHLRHR
jgi:BirA family biotin operon repressor/biotin-[acetyl-CoA-carboxylase] ligase